MARVGFVSTWFERGAAYVTKQYISLLESNLEYDVFIYARGGESYAIGDSNWDAPNVHWATKTFIPEPMAIEKNDFVKWIRKNKIEIIFFNEQQWIIPVVWAKEIGVKTICYVDYYTEKSIPEFINYDLLICNTLRHYNLFKKHHPNVRLLPWGTDLQVFKKTALVSNSPVFFHSCGMSPIRKGTDLLLDAFSKIESDRKRLFIHSQVDLKKALPNHSELISSLIVNGQLEIYEGSVTAPGLFHKGNIYVYPTRLEGIGLTIVEALSSGLPVIVPNSPPMSEFALKTPYSKLVDVDEFVSRSDGYYWPQSIVSVDSLKEKLLYFLDLGEDDLISMADSVRDAAVYNFNWTTNAIGFVEALEYVRSSPSSKAFFVPHQSSLITQYYLKFPILFSRIYFIYRGVKKCCF